MLDANRESTELHARFDCMGGSMKIHAYKVISPNGMALDTTLTALAALPLADRIRPISMVPMRLENGAKPGAAWLLDFALIRHEGPGRASAVDPISDFDLQEDEGFGQETAAYFDTASGFMILQYNHFGPRIGRIQTYLNSFLTPPPGGIVGPDDGFDFQPVMSATAVAKLEHLRIVKNIEVSFYVPGVLARDEPRAQSVTSILNFPLIGTAAKFTFQVSAARGNEGSLSVDGVRRLVTDFLHLRDDVSALSLVARETAEGPNEPLDFLEARLQADIPLTLGAGRRYARDDRIAALRQAFDSWQASHLL